MSNVAHALDSSVSRRPERSLRWGLLLAMDLLVGLAALGGGLSLALRPDGALLRMPRSLLEGSAFTDFLVPGLVLFLVIGVGHLVAAALALRASPRAWLASCAAGGALMIWIAAQVAVIGARSWLQIVLFLLGAAIAIEGLALRPPGSLAGAIRSAVAACPLAWYFGLAFGCVWIHAIPEAAAATGHMRPLAPATTGALRLIALLGGPVGAAALVTALVEGRAGLGRWLESLGRGRASWRWYALAIFGYPALAAASIAAADVIRGTPWSFGPYFRARVAQMAAGLGMDAGRLWPALPVLVGYGFTIVPLFEEPGWRGFALPRLQRKLGPRGAAIGLGCIWALWHLPNFSIPGSPHHGMPFLGFLVEIVALSVLLTWMFNATGGSVLLAMAMHGSTIVGSIFFPAGVPATTGDLLAYWLSVGGAMVTTAAALLVAGSALGAPPPGGARSRRRRPFEIGA